MTKRLEPAEAARRRTAGRHKMWARPEYREKMKSHPWRQSYTVIYSK